MTSLPAEIGNLINLIGLDVSNNQLISLPADITKLVKLMILDLHNNHLISLPVEIVNLIKLEELYLWNNKLTGLPNTMLKFIQITGIDVDSYDINNLNIYNEILIFNQLNGELTNLPTCTKEIWISDSVKDYNIKLPFGCVIKKFKITNRAMYSLFTTIYRNDMHMHTDYE